MGPRCQAQDRERNRINQSGWEPWFSAMTSGILHYRIDPPLPTHLPIDEQIAWVLSHTEIVAANPAAGRLLHMHLDDLVGAPLSEVWGKNNPAARDTVRHWIENGYREDGTETRERLRDGRDVWFFNEASRVPSGDTVAEYWVMFRDITATKTAEQELRQLHEDLERRVQDRTAELHAAIENVPAELWATDADFRYTIQNGRSRRSIGDRRGTRITDLPISKELLDAWLSDNERVMQGEIVEQEYVFPVDGHDRDFVARISPILVDGKVVGTIGTAMDVTERKAAEQTLRENEAYLRTLMHNMPVDFFAMDVQMRYTMQSALSRSVVGDVIGESVEATGAPEALKQQWREEHRMVLNGESIHRVYEIPMPDETRTFMTTVAPVIVDSEVIGTVGTSMDITEQKRIEAKLRQTQQELEERVISRTQQLRASKRRLGEILEGTIAAFAQTVEARDPYTAGHQENVASLSAAIAKKLELSRNDVHAARVAGLLHDIGKISIPAEILAKPTKLSDVEWEMIKGHSENAYRILRGIPFPWPIAEIVLQHHEKLDGSGYPNGLRGEAILKVAQILAVADTVEAMAAHRPYRAALGLEVGLDVIRRGRGTLYDADVATACLTLFEAGTMRLQSK